MATGSDVRDILSLSGGSNPAPGGSSNRRGAARRSGPPGAAALKKPGRVDGMTRELYALLGDNVPSLAIAQAHTGPGAAKFRPKFKRRPQKSRAWVLEPFRNPGRNDDLVLHHWVPAKSDEQQQQQAEQESGDATQLAASSSSLPERTYKFAQFNTNSGVYNYSNDEYHQHLRDDDWSKEETDYLVELCQTYDLRFVIIHDRYEWRGKGRSIEDLKARYYALCRRLIRSRITTADMDARQSLLATYTFDRARETERKRAVERLFSRTPAQLAEEEALYVEARRLEQNEARFAGEREDLLKLLGGWERVPGGDHRAAMASAGAGLGYNIQGSVPAPEELATDGKRKRRKVDGGLDDEAGQSRSAAALTSKQRGELKQAQYDEQHCITRFDPSPAASAYKLPYPHLVGTSSMQPPGNPTPSNQSASHGAFLRSTRILAPRASLAQRTTQTLSELRPHVGPRLVFPTARNVERWEGLLGAVTSGLEMKRQLDRVESEVRTLQARLSATQQPSREASQVNGDAAARAASRTPAFPGRTSASATPAPTAVEAGAEAGESNAGVES